MTATPATPKTGIEKQPADLGSSASTRGEPGSASSSHPRRVGGPSPLGSAWFRALTIVSTANEPVTLSITPWQI